MFFLQFQARPKPHNPESNELAGAFVGCWIERSTLPEAEEVARSMISEAGWDVISTNLRYPVDRSSYDDKPSGLQYYEQAILDKEVLVFDSYPIKEETDKNENGFH